MTRARADARRLAERFHQASLAGLVLSGYLALVGSGYLGVRAALLAGGGVVSLLALSLLFTARFGKRFVFVEIFACLELLAAALLSASLSFFLFLGAFVFFLVATQASGEIRRSAGGRTLVARGGVRGFHARLGGLIFCAGLGILVLTAGLFFVLPRTANAALHRFAAERYQLAGFSSDVRLGQIGAILNRNTPAMHVRVIGQTGPLYLKWRGAALTSFDGKRWWAPAGGDRVIQVEDGRSILADDDQRRLAGPRITYEIQLETIASDVLFFAGLPEVLWIQSPSIRETGEAVYRLGVVPERRLRYGAIGYLEGTRPSSAPGEEHLQLPALDERIRVLAREVTAREVSDEMRARALESHLSRSFEYTTELPSVEPADPLAHFLFESLRGHCEYFASAMAVMLRTLGIPSRLVTGFQGGELSPITGWYVVRASDAHVWVEAWIHGKGWMTFDPTPAGRSPRRSPLLARVLFYTDAAEMFWQDWVVGYDLERQVTLAARMQGSGRVAGARWLDGFRLGFLRRQDAAWRAVRAYGLQVLALVLLGGALYLLAPKIRTVWEFRQRFHKARSGGAVASDATLLYRRMLDLLKRRGYQKPAWFTPGEFVRGLPPSEAAEVAAGFTSAYHDLRYGGRPEAAQRMIALLGRLERLS